MIRQTALIPLRERITGCEPLKHLPLTALMLQKVSSLGRGCRTRRDLSLVWYLQNLDFEKYFGQAIWTRLVNSWLFLTHSFNFLYIVSFYIIAVFVFVMCYVFFECLLLNVIILSCLVLPLLSLSLIFFSIRLLQ